MSSNVSSSQKATPPQPAAPKPQAPAAKPAPPPAFSIVSSATFRERYIKALFYGPYGVGKTSLAASAQDIPGMQNVLFLDAESGGLTLAKRNDIDAVRVTNYRQVARVYDFLRAHCQFRDAGEDDKLLDLDRKFRDPKATEPKIYRTVVVDSLTEIAKFSMYQLLNISIGAQQLDHEMETAEWKQWGQSTEMIRLLVRTLRDLPIHVIMVCSEKDTENERKQMIKGLNLPATLAREVPGFFDIVGYYLSGYEADNKIHRKLFLNPGRTFLAKHRLGRDVPDSIEDPTMGHLLDLLNSP